MKILILLLLIPSTCFAQYVAQTLQQRIDNDNNSIALDQADIGAKQADIDNIVSDQQANQVTSQVPDVQTIQAQTISTQPTMGVLTLNSAI